MYAGQLPLRELYLQGRHDLHRDFILYSKYVFQIPIVAFRPQVMPRLSFNELGGYPDPLTGFLDAALHHIANAQLAAPVLFDNITDGFTVSG